MAQQTNDAWVNIREIQHKHEFFYQVALGLVLVIVGIVIGAKLFPSDESYGSNVYLNVISVFATIVVLNRLAERREEQREEKALKERLVMEVGSQSNETAKSAVDELGYNGWLEGEDGLLKAANLWGANLQGANLYKANLKGANLGSAKLQQVNLMDAELQEANLQFAQLQGAKLMGANLHGTRFGGANLQKADLSYTDASFATFPQAQLTAVDLQQANLQGAGLGLCDLRNANFYNANLRGAILDLSILQGANLWEANLQDLKTYGVRFDEQTTLPDNTKWKLDIEMERFTDPQHPNFWRSDNPNSPAYRGTPPTS